MYVRSVSGLCYRPSRLVGHHATRDPIIEHGLVQNALMHALTVLAPLLVLPLNLSSNTRFLNTRYLFRTTFGVVSLAVCITRKKEMKAVWDICTEGW